MYLNEISNTKLELWNQCRLKYKYRYVDHYQGDSDINGDSLSFGTYIHEIFQLGVNAKHIKELEHIAESIKHKHKLAGDHKNRINTCLKNFLEFNTKISKAETIGTELSFKIKEEKSNIIFTGVIDRVIKSSSSNFLIIDYKTSKREKTKSTLFQDPQLQGYCYAISKLYDIPLEEVSKRIICAHYYPLTNHFVDVSFTKPMLLQHVGRVVESGWKIRKAKLEDLTPKRNEFCDYCEFKCMCPIYTDKSSIDNRILLEETKKKSTG